MDRERAVAPLPTGIFALLLLASAPASAHFFVQSYALPIPFWMYAWGAAGALLLSFMAVGIFATVPSIGKVHGASGIQAGSDYLSKTGTAGYSALALLAVCIVSGFLGPLKSVDNFNMTFFWIVFVLGVPYLTAFIGNFYSRMNPWEALVIALERWTGQTFHGKLKRADRLGHWPAVVLYGGFINLELFGHLLPRGLSVWLLWYSFLNVVGAWLLGRRAWFQQGEFFGVMLGLIGRMAPIERADGRVRLRMPFSGLLKDHPEDIGLVVFILFMLSSTAFDGLHATQPWANLYWSVVNPLLTEGWGLTPREQNSLSVVLYQSWQRSNLAFSPFLYLGLLTAVLVIVKALVRSNLSLRVLLCRFAPCLVPIAFVYHFTHYFTLLLAQGGQMIRLISDPLALGWNLFGTSNWTIPPVMVDMGTLWHAQVGLILAGHVASVWVGHVEALSLFHSPRRAALSQMPMLALMMVFTAFGLWILSLPLVTGG